MSWRHHGPLTRCVKLRVAHAPGMPGTFSLPSTSKETAIERSWHASRHVCHACAVMHVGIANPRWRGKRYRYSQRMRNRNFTYLVRGPWACMPSCFRSFPGSRGRTCAVHVRDETHHRIPWSLWLPSKHALVTDSALAIRNGQSIANTLRRPARTDRHQDSQTD